MDLDRRNIYAAATLDHVKQTNDQPSRQRSPDHTSGQDRGANWAGDLDARRSTTGYVFFLNGSVIS